MKEEIEKAIQVLKNGGVIAYPTDTVWGIGCDATNEKAVQKVLEIKNRPESKSLIILLDEAGKLNKYLRDVPGIAWDLIEVSDRPLTIVYDDPQHLAASVINQEDNSVGIRITSDPFCRDLIHRFNKPLVSTSANKSGEPSPSNYTEISEEILSAVDYVVNLRRQEKTRGIPSVVMKVNQKGEVKILRK